MKELILFMSVPFLATVSCSQNNESVLLADAEGYDDMTICAVLPAEGVIT